MPSVPIPLQQAAPSAGVITDLYQIPLSYMAVTGSGVVCNFGSATDYFRISVGVNGASAANQQFLYYDLPLDAPDTFAFTFGLTFGSQDVIRVYSRLGFCAFNISLIKVS